MSISSCGVKGCDRSAHRVVSEIKMCTPHFKRTSRYGSPHAGGPIKVGRPRVIEADATCSEPSCSGPVKARGICNKHYVRRQRSAQAA